MKDKSLGAGAAMLELRRVGIGEGVRAVIVEIDVNGKAAATKRRIAALFLALHHVTGKTRKTALDRTTRSGSRPVRG